MLLQVVMKRWDGARIWYPNQTINMTAITNVTRTDTRCQWFKVRLTHVKTKVQSNQDMVAISKITRTDSALPVVQGAAK